MNKILTNNNIASEIIALIEETNEYCFLVSPFYKPWPLLERALEKASNKNKRLVFIFRNEIQKEYQNHLHKELGFDIYFIDRLHTKLYLNEKRVIISSMNLYDSSKENNYEIGYSIDGVKASKDFLQKIIKEDILSLNSALHLEGSYTIYSREQEKAKQGKKVAESKKLYNFNPEVNGYCIRCGTSIKLNPAKPLCNSCYSDWIRFDNPEYPEKYCHHCRIESRTSMNKPLCFECYKVSAYYNNSL